MVKIYPFFGLKRPPGKAVLSGEKADLNPRKPNRIPSYHPFQWDWNGISLAPQPVGKNGIRELGNRKILIPRKVMLPKPQVQDSLLVLGKKVELMARASKLRPQI